MNKLEGKIASVKSSEGLLLIQTAVGEDVLSAIIIGRADNNPFEEGKRVKLLFKETEVFLAKEPAYVSIQNRLKCEVVRIEKGELLVTICLSYGEVELQSVITLNGLNSLGLHEGDKVLAMIKTNEIVLYS